VGNRELSDSKKNLTGPSNTSMIPLKIIKLDRNSANFTKSQGINAMVRRGPLELCCALDHTIIL
jgi:hypothetical protein